MSETATVSGTESTETTTINATTPPTTDATSEAGTAETTGETAAKADEASAESEKKEPTQGEINRKARNRERWQRMKEDARRAESRAERAEAELARLKGEQDPDWSQYQDPNEELADRVIRKLQKSQIPDLERFAKSSRSEAKAIETQQVFDMIDDGRGRFPDFDAVIFGREAIYHKALVPFLANDERGADIAYYLGKNPRVASNLYELFDTDQASAYVELGRITAQMSSLSPKSASTAPAPAKTIVGNSSTPAKTPDEMTFSEYEAWRMGKT